MISKMGIYMYARSIANFYVGLQNGKVRDWEFLKEMYDKAMEVPPVWTATPAGDNLKAIQDGKWLRKDGARGGTSDEKAGMSWCGILAVYVLQGVGIPVKWKPFVGIAPLSPYLEMCNYDKAKEIEPGDICVKGTNQHHFIVHNRVGNMLYSYDGNLPGQSIGERNYDISDMLQAAKSADVEMAKKRKEMPPEIFRTYITTFSKYNFYFYRLKKA